MAENNNAPSASPDTVGVILEMREQAREARQSDPDAGIFADHAYADLLDEWANRLERHDGRMSGLVRDYIEGMSVSIDVSTGEHDAGNRYYGFVSEVMDDPGDKHGVTLLVQDDVRPNFKVSASPAALTDERIREIWDAYVDWSDSPRDGIAFARAVLLAASPADQVDFNPVEAVGVELARVEAGPDPRGVDTLIEALDCTLNAHGFEVRPRDAEGERDTARLDWLQEFYDGFHNIDRITAVRGKFNLHSTLRAAIDQSMSATPPADESQD